MQRNISLLPSLLPGIQFPFPKQPLFLYIFPLFLLYPCIDVYKHIFVVFKNLQEVKLYPVFYTFFTYQQVLEVSPYQYVYHTLFLLVATQYFTMGMCIGKHCGLNPHITTYQLCILDYLPKLCMPQLPLYNSAYYSSQLGRWLLGI